MMILELREKRNKAWEAAKAFLDSTAQKEERCLRRAGMMSARDGRRLLHKRMWIDLKKEE